MLSAKAKLSNKIFRDDLAQVAARDGYGKALVELGEKIKIWYY